MYAQQPVNAAALAAAAGVNLPPLPQGAVVRTIVMKDAVSAEQLRQKLEQLKASGLFRAGGGRIVFTPMRELLRRLGG